MTNLVIHIDDGSKHVILSMAQVEKLIEVLGQEDKTLVSNFLGFCKDVLDSNSDAGKVELTPENAGKILGTGTAPALPEITEQHQNFLKSKGLSWAAETIESTKQFISKFSDLDLKRFLADFEEWVKKGLSGSQPVQPSTSQPAASDQQQGS